ncbi:MAG: 3-hydroxyacyl-CoA dehydrogenase family protein, partial [Cyanobacteria bacterium REEB65]|nr:3-hydroxyacyl-CoA dehydrogenase family protein [Cyanobacteria bacterium REEB65]
MALLTPALALKANPLAVAKVGIIGGGAMGGGIAQVVSAAGFPVVLIDLSPELVQKGLAAAYEVYDRRVKKGKMAAAEADQKKALLRGSTTIDDLADCDLVIEAVTEKLDVKKEVFVKLDAVMPEHAILASNTSALSITQLAAVTHRPTKVVGLHFFNPAPVMELVEVIRGQQTSDQTAATLLQFSEMLGKKPVLIHRDEPGFLVNRLLLAYFNEAVLALQENGASEAEKIDQIMVSHGFPMGPFALGDLVGVEVCTHVMHTLHDAFGPRFPRAELLDKMVAAGRWGQKRGAGFYLHGQGEPQWLATAIAEVQAERQLLPTPVTFERLIGVMINEAARLVEDGLVSKDDIDPAMQLGTGMARGPLEIADQLGIDEVLRVLDDLRDLGPRFEPSMLLRRMAVQGKL